MDFNKYSKRAYAPYFKESIHCIEVFVFVSIILLVLFSILFVYLEISAYYILIIGLVVYALLDCAFNHRLSILAVTEMRKGDWIKQEVVIKDIILEHSSSGYMGQSVIPKLYPKELGMERYKLVCENEKKEKVVLRTVMSRRKHKLLVNQIFIEKGAKSFIYYGKRTKIVLCYKSGEAWTDTLNHMF